MVAPSPAEREEKEKVPLFILSTVGVLVLVVRSSTWEYVLYSSQ